MKLAITTLLLSVNILQAFSVEFTSSSLANTTTWNTEAATDTAAIRVDRDGDVYIATNTKTRTLPFQRNFLTFETTSDKMGPTDNLTIMDTIRKNPYFRDKPAYIIGTYRENTAQLNAKPLAKVIILADRQNNQQSPSSASNQSTPSSNATAAFEGPFGTRAGDRTSTNYNAPPTQATKSVSPTENISSNERVRDKWFYRFHYKTKDGKWKRRNPGFPG